MNESAEKTRNAGAGQPSRRERYQQRKLRKAEGRLALRRKRSLKTAVRAASAVLIAGGTIFSLGWYISTRPILPPTIVQGHTEDMPATHITDRPLPDGTQRHMLEHADGRGKPGVIVQYNCKKYSCASDLVAKLTDLIKRYPDNVYLAPNGYDAKIVLTKRGQSETLERFDEKAIKAFIG